MSSHLEKYWLIIVAFLLVSLIAGGIILSIKQSSHKPVEIALSQGARCSIFSGALEFQQQIERLAITEAS